MKFQPPPAFAVARAGRPHDVAREQVRFVVAVRPRARPTKPYKYVAGDRLTLHLAAAAKYVSKASAERLAAQMRSLAGDAHVVVVLPTTLPATKGSK
jgi:hypothetical protein